MRPAEAPAGLRATCEFNMIKFLSICHNTFTQTIREPIYGILIVVTFGVLVMTLPLSDWTMGESGGDYRETNQMMLENQGLGTLLMAGMMMAAFTASGALTREIRDKTALTVISKPVSRATFVLGKFAGVTVAVALAYWLCTLVFLMTVRHQVMSSASDPYDFPVIVLGITAVTLAILVALAGNFFFGWPFTSAAVWASLISLTVAMGLISVIGKGWTVVPFGHDIRPELLVGVLLIFMGVLLFVATAIAAGTRLWQVATLLVCVGFFVVGSFHPYIFQQRGKDVVILRVIGWVAPNLTYFYSMDTLSSRTGSSIPPSLVGLAGAYCALYAGAILAVGVALFQHRQMDARPSSGSLPGAVALMAWAGRGGALLAGLVALVRLSLPQYYTPRGFMVIAAMLAAAVVAWLLWGYFGRGTRWAWMLVTAGAALVCVAAGAIVVARAASDWLAERVGAAPPTIGLIAAAGVLLLLMLPKTRRHFRTEHQ